MSNTMLVVCLAFMALCAIYGVCHFIDNFIDGKKPAKDQKRHGVHTPDDIGYLLIKRDFQGAQASVHFSPDFDLFKYEDGDYIFLGIKVEEVE